MGEEEPTPQREFVPRIGTFFIILGIFALIFFLASDFANQTDFDWLFIGMVLLGIGFLFRRRAAAPPSAGRFSSVHRIRESARKRKEDRERKAKK